jgi:hypothetical protein
MSAAGPPCISRIWTAEAPELAPHFSCCVPASLGLPASLLSRLGLSLRVRACQLQWDLTPTVKELVPILKRLDREVLLPWLDFVRAVSCGALPCVLPCILARQWFAPCHRDGPILPFTATQLQRHRIITAQG